MPMENGVPGGWGLLGALVGDCASLAGEGDT